MNPQAQARLDEADAALAAELQRWGTRGAGQLMTGMFNQGVRAADVLLAVAGAVQRGEVRLDETERSFKPIRTGRKVR